MKDGFTETGGSFFKARCPDVAMVKQDLTQSSCEQCVTRTEDGLAYVQPQSRPTTELRLGGSGNI